MRSFWFYLGLYALYVAVIILFNWVAHRGDGK
jgi:hypothetical protein